MEQNDYRRGKPNVFFGAEKRYLGMKVGVFAFNTLCLIASTLGLLGTAALDLAKATRSAARLTGRFSLRLVAMTALVSEQ